MAESEAEPDGTFPMTDVLRAPLEKITRQAEAIRSQSFGHLKSVYTDYAGDIATAARHLRTLIDDVFDVAAIESGTVSLLIENVDLTTLAEERPEEHTSELQSLMRNSYAVFCLKKKTHRNTTRNSND